LPDITDGSGRVIGFVGDLVHWIPMERRHSGTPTGLQWIGRFSTLLSSISFQKASSQAGAWSWGFLEVIRMNEAAWSARVWIASTTSKVIAASPACRPRDRLFRSPSAANPI